jgi:isoleucyl-tRNA synthetase
MTRMGCWADLDQPYRTMDPGYVESVWWSLRQAYQAGLLTRDYLAAPYCPRCQTPLSDYELQAPGAFRKATRTAVTVRFRLLSLPDGLNPWLQGADLLVRTERAWSLVPATAIAVHPHRVYAVAKRAGSDDRVVVSEPLVPRVLGEGWHIVARVPGADLAGARYQPFVSLGGSGADDSGAHPVITGYFVPADTGTGLALIVPAFGSDDLRASQASAIGAPDPIGPDGCFGPDVPLVPGLFFTAAEPVLIGALADRRLLFAERRQEHCEPHCWRCGTPLMTRAMSAWYLRTAAVSERLTAERRRVHWMPDRDQARDTGGPGAAAPAPGTGGWPAGDSGWVVSRSRYWGTPLPLWECEQGHLTCVGSLAELSELAGLNLMDVDPHRPAVDLVTVSCPTCGTAGHRVTDVVDSWYDTGSMPFAQHGPPPAGPGWLGSERRAQLVVETAQAAGGWTDAMLTIGTMVFGHGPFETALRLGPVLDVDGRPMTRNLGNLIEPLPLIERYGADALRWLCTVAAAPGTARKVSVAALDEIVRKILLTYLNTAAFLITHLDAAAASGEPWLPDHPGTPPPAARPLLDQWILAELDSAVADVTAALDSFQPDAAGRRLASFIDDLSNWYLRRSRQRFRLGPASPDGAAAFATLHTSVHVLTRVMAPIVPFLSDYIWNLLTAATRSGSGGPQDSVHLARWPEPAPRADGQLAEQMALARRLTGLGRSARAAASVRTRQPLASAVVAVSGASSLCDELRSLVADELNVRTLDLLDAAEHEQRVILDLTLSPELRREGMARDAVRVIQAARKADKLQISDLIEVRWSAEDPELALALTEHGAWISTLVRAADFGPQSDPADLSAEPGTRDHVSARLGLAFSMRPLNRVP